MMNLNNQTRSKHSSAHIKSVCSATRNVRYPRVRKAEKSRKEDLLLYLAMGLFEKRKPYTQQPESLKRDIKALFVDYKTALNFAAELLFAIADTDLIKCTMPKKHMKNYLQVC